MKYIQVFGLFLFVAGLLLFSLLPFIGQNTLTEEVLLENAKEDHAATLLDVFSPVMDKTYSSHIRFISDINSLLDAHNEDLKEQELWDEVIWDDYAFILTKASGHGPVQDKTGLFLVLALVVPIAGALAYIFPMYRNEPEGIKNDRIYFSAMEARGWLGIVTGTYLILFYVILYWFPEYLANSIKIFDPVSFFLSGNEASQWFMYGALYTLAILVMGIRIFRKYRGNTHQVIRTVSVMFFQLSFAFLIPEILVRFNKPWYDFKNIWPLDYSFFFEYRVSEMLSSGTLGLFILFWGILLIILSVPILAYFYGKRWYCSWVCGCGGLAETLGDPYRHLSDKRLKAWQIERYMVHGVFVFAIIMTAVTIWNYFSGFALLGEATDMLHQWYGFLIGSAFAGVIGVGFYPFMGCRVWCRFGCPLAAYLGIVQRFKSRFRITTNGGQCISCGNCSTYCEMGIDVKWYAQRGQNIVRASCVGCGVCSAVCPRGVLRLENKETKERINTHPIIIGNDSIEVKN
jgi:polyferredoxin